VAEADDLTTVEPLLGQASLTAEPLYQRVERWLRYRWVGVLLIAGAVVLPLLRQRGTPSWQTVWAEDTTIYTHQAVFSGSFGVLFRGYNGYLQLPPRLLAIPTPYFPLRYLAVYLALAATVVAALLAWCVYYLSRAWLVSRLLRVTLASFVVLMPVLGLESTATITNITWLFLAVGPWALISLEERRGDTCLRSGLAFLAATSSALSLLFLPLAIGWIAYRRSRAALIVGGCFVGGLIVQMAVTLTSPPGTGAKIGVSVLAQATSARVFGVFVLGTRGEAAWWGANWNSLVILAPLSVLVLFVVLGIGASRRAQVMASGFVLLAILMFAVPAWGRDTNFLGLVEGHPDRLVESRFSVVPVMLLASAIAILLSPVGSSSRQRRRAMQRIGIPAFMAWFIIVMVVSFSQTTIRGSDPSWTGRVDKVLASDCSGRPGSTIVTVPNLIAPGPPYPKVYDGYYPLVARCSNLA
jgi:hypothetical protein